MNQTTPPLTGRQVFLGVFIVAQLLFLVLRNGVDMQEQVRKKVYSDKEQKGLTKPIAIDHVAPGWVSETGHIRPLLDSFTEIVKTYTQLTEQPQAWKLFAPWVTRECVFPALEIRWTEPVEPAPVALQNPFAVLGLGDPLQVLGLAALTGKEAKKEDMPPADPPAGELFLSDNEPPDMKSYVRVGNFRLRKFECDLVLTLYVRPNETESQAKERWARWIREHLEPTDPHYSYGDIVFAYMAWRTEEIMRRTGKKTLPAEVILMQRRFKIALPGDGPPYVTEPDSIPLARWRPSVAVAADYSPLEMFDPVTNNYRHCRRK